LGFPQAIHLIGIAARERFLPIIRADNQMRLQFQSQDFRFGLDYKPFDHLPQQALLDLLIQLFK